jgi:two-component system, NarL family, invasion response regulator UvrY
MRILIADDHAIVRRGLKQLLLEHYPFAEITEAADAEQLVAHVIKGGEWNIVICDLNMPGRSGLDALSQIKEISPSLPVLIMSMYPEDQYALRVIRAGASGYLGKETIHDDLIKAVEAVKLGKRYITPGLAEKLADAASSKTSSVLLVHENLSDREFDVFKLLAGGKQVSEIAIQLSLSSTTVSTYRSRIMDKMNMKSNAELAKYAVEHRLL